MTTTDFKRAPATISVHDGLWLARETNLRTPGSESDALPAGLTRPLIAPYLSHAFCSLLELSASIPCPHLKSSKKSTLSHSEMLRCS